MPPQLSQESKCYGLSGLGNVWLIGIIASLLEHRDRRSETSKLDPRGRDTTPVVWCDFGSKTYISVDYVGDIRDQSWNGVDDFLDAVGVAIRVDIRTTGDGDVPGGLITYQSSGLVIISQNANNHQQTWGVLGAGIAALSDYMLAQKEKGYSPSSVEFLIYDGPNQVANATFRPKIYGW